MSTLIEKANQILSEKNDKIIPENIKSGVTVFGVEGTLEAPSTPICVHHETTGYYVNTKVVAQETMSVPESLDGVYFDVLGMYCLNSQTIIELAVTNVSYTGTAIGTPTTFSIVMYNADKQSTTIGGIVTLPDTGRTIVTTYSTTLNYADSICSLGIENISVSD